MEKLCKAKGSPWRWWAPTIEDYIGMIFFWTIFRGMGSFSLNKEEEQGNTAEMTGEIIWNNEMFVLLQLVDLNE